MIDPFDDDPFDRGDEPYGDWDDLDYDYYDRGADDE